MSEWIVCPSCLKKAEQGAESCPHCGQSMKNQNPRGALAYGSLLAGRYTVGEFLRADGEGILYRAVENNAAVRVTIKEYLPVTLAADRDAEGSVNPKAGSEVLYKTTRMDFVDLYQELLKLTPTTGLETVLDVFEANNTAYAVMENPGGIPLDEYLASAGGRIAPADMLHIIAAHDRCAAGESVPACGLFLVDVGYPKEVVHDEPSPTEEA